MAQARAGPTLNSEEILAVVEEGLSGSDELAIVILGRICLHFRIERGHKGPRLQRGVVASAIDELREVGRGPVTDLVLDLLQAQLVEPPTLSDLTSLPGLGQNAVKERTRLQKRQGFFRLSGFISSDLDQLIGPGTVEGGRVLRVGVHVVGSLHLGGAENVLRGLIVAQLVRVDSDSGTVGGS